MVCWSYFFGFVSFVMVIRSTDDSHSDGIGVADEIQFPLGEICKAEQYRQLRLRQGNSPHQGSISRIHCTQSRSCTTAADALK